MAMSIVSRLNRGHNSSAWWVLECLGVKLSNKSTDQVNNK